MSAPLFMHKRVTPGIWLATPHDGRKRDASSSCAGLQTGMCYALSSETPPLRRVRSPPVRAGASLYPGRRRHTHAVAAGPGLIPDRNPAAEAMERRAPVGLHQTVMRPSLPNNEFRMQGAGGLDAF